ncbi:hypothetical protein BCF53_1321 [Reinekea marinisedimentorum]|uniref:Uncharacterized protein n=1 Tax=Reinekea marinisedimentorum TaxID=230495 RepID=A0A4V2UIC8_9GAMM|nr:hypothetical protein BCF53_1321 [Reinekea marinisedimentorum]
MSYMSCQDKAELALDPVRLSLSDYRKYQLALFFWAIQEFSANHCQSYFDL